MTNKLAYSAFFCALVFLITMVSIHFLKSELHWMSNTLSEYAIGDRGYIINIGFYCIATTQIAITALLVLDKHFSSNLSPVFLMLAGVGALLVAIFPVQPPTASLSDRLPHMAGAIIQFLFFPLALLRGKDFFQASSFSAYTRFTARTTFLFFAILLGLFILKSRYEFAYFGLVEKIDIVLITLWLLVYSFVSMRNRL